MNFCHFLMTTSVTNILGGHAKSVGRMFALGAVKSGVGTGRGRAPGPGQACDGGNCLKNRHADSRDHGSHRARRMGLRQVGRSARSIVQLPAGETN